MFDAEETRVNAGWLDDAMNAPSRLASHRRIARRDAAELCKDHPKQASRILARLTRRGDLVMHGKKRGTWYGLREDGDTKL